MPVSEALVRHGLGIVGTLLAARGFEVEGTGAELYGSLMVLSSVVWSIIEKVRRRRTRR